MFRILSISFFFVSYTNSWCGSWSISTFPSHYKPIVYTFGIYRIHFVSIYASFPQQSQKYLLSCCNSRYLLELILWLSFCFSSCSLSYWEFDSATFCHLSIWNSLSPFMISFIISAKLVSCPLFYRYIAKISATYSWWRYYRGKTFLTIFGLEHCLHWTISHNSIPNVWCGGH